MGLSITTMMAGRTFLLPADMCIRRWTSMTGARAWRNVRGGKFELVPAVKGTGLADVITARGAAFGDLFNDGKIDVVMNNLDASPTLLRNVNDDAHHWIEFKLIGGAKSPRDAVGAAVFLKTGKMEQRGDVLSGD